MATEITTTFVSERLRSIRHAQSLSLSDVENASDGAIKAVVLGRTSEAPDHSASSAQFKLQISIEFPYRRSLAVRPQRAPLLPEE